MVRLSRTRLVKRSLLFAIFLIAITAGAFVTAKNIKLFQVNAADGQAAVSSSGGPISYDDTATYRYSVTVGGKTYNALCAEPKKAPPAGASYAYSSLNNNKIKLLVYLATNNSAAANSLVNTLYGDLADTSDQRFAYIHATIGAVNGDYNGLNENYDRIYNIANGTGSGSLANAINNNADAWLIAKNYTLYATNPTDNTYQSVVWIEDNFQSGSIKVQKCDKETSSCTTPQEKASFSGIKFEVYNNSGSRIYNPQNGNFYNNGALMASGTTNASGTVTFSNLPLNVKYQVKEAATNSSYLLTALAQTTTITTNNATNELKFYDDVIRGDVKFTKTSDVDDEPMTNVVFKIKSTTGTKEEHLVVTDEDGVVDTSSAHALHSFHTNGYDDMEEDEIEYLAYGTWFGGGTANDARGALPYGTYTITELQCDANKFCYDIGSESKTVTIKTNNQIVDLGEWSNDCVDITLETTATDAGDDDKFIEVGAQAVIKDIVEYCVMPGYEYTLKGILMDKATGEKLLVDGQPVTSEATISPTEECGYTTMLFKFDSTELAGKDVVVFETLYLNDEVVVSHEDIEDDNQTISIISLSTTATDNADGDKILSADKDVEIKDRVDYCLKAGEEFVIEGVVMNKQTKKPLLVDGKPVKQTLSITPETACGATAISYTFSTKDLASAELVIFEDVYHDGELVLSHSNFDDEGQSISVAPPVPDTGVISSNGESSTENGNNFVAIAIISVIGGYVAVRLAARRKFYSKG